MIQSENKQSYQLWAVQFHSQHDSFHKFTSITPKEATTSGHFSWERNARQVQIVGDRASPSKVGTEFNPLLGKHQGANKHEIVFLLSFFHTASCPPSRALCFGPELCWYCNLQ